MKKLLAVLLLAGSSIFGQISVGIRIGPPPAPRMIRSQPRSPGAGYTWVDGYWYPSNNRYVWHAGYYTRPPYDGAIWVGPRYEGQQFYEGYWSANDQQYRHDHRWDRDKKYRDYDGNPGRGRGNQR
jgi:YXWGXW repeat-containing protein